MLLTVDGVLVTVLMTEFTGLDGGGGEDGGGLEDGGDCGGGVYVPEGA